MTIGGRRVFLGLGSNLGARRSHLRRALEMVPDTVAVSPVYETDPVGGPDQGPYLNCVVELWTSATPRELLAIAKSCESVAGRVRSIRWGPRTLDVDILWIDGEKIDEPDLIVPHPRMFDRAFVLVPLHALAPDLVPDLSNRQWQEEVVAVDSAGLSLPLDL